MHPMQLLTDSWEVFVLLFAIMSLLPILPVVVSVVGELPPERARRTMITAMITVAVVGALLALFGGAFLRSWGASIDDLRVAGGSILLIFAIYDLLFARATRKAAAHEMQSSTFSLEGEFDDDDGVGIVPLAIPIILGPAGMAALLVTAETRGDVPVLLAFGANVLINTVILLNAARVARLLGRPIIRASGKVMGVFLAALAVSMIRRGVLAI